VGRPHEVLEETTEPAQGQASDQLFILLLPERAMVVLGVVVARHKVVAPSSFQALKTVIYRLCGPYTYRYGKFALQSAFELFRIRMLK
jgi:hypothetical protein